MATRRGGSGGIGKFFLGFFSALLLAAAVLFLYFHFGAPPVAVADQPFLFERAIVRAPLSARIARQTAEPPFGISEDVFEAGARVYRQECAACHGTPGHDVAFAAHMYPRAPQLFKKHPQSAVVGVSDDPPGETRWKIANGIRLTGMPSYNQVLSDNQIWQVALLLKNADQPLPDPVERILNAPKPQAP